MNPLMNNSRLCDRLRSLYIAHLTQTEQISTDTLNQLRVLRALPSRAAYEVLVRYVTWDVRGSLSRKAREIALEALTALPGACTLHRQKLTSESWRERAASAFALSHLRDEASVPVLVNGLLTTDLLEEGRYYVLALRYLDWQPHGRTLIMEINLREQGKYHGSQSY